MAIEKISVPLSGKDVCAKINEIIDVVNTKYVVNTVVSGKNITVTYSDGTSAENTYETATTTTDGLMAASMVESLEDLKTRVSQLEGES